MPRNGAFGVLMLTCSMTGQTIDTGVRYDADDLSRTNAAKLRMRCPHCGKTHLFNFADAKLRPLNNNESSA